MTEYLIIKALLNRDIYDRYYVYIPHISNKELQRILYSVKQLHSTGKETYSVDELKLVFLTDYPSLKEAEVQKYEILFKRIDEAQADATHIEGYLKSLRERELSRKIAVEALEVSEGRKDISSVIELTKQLEVDQPLEEEIETLPTSLSALLEEYDNEPGFRWRLKCLNESLGYFRKGTHGHIFARIEVGKSALWISELTYMVQQMTGDQLACVFFNEEDGKGTFLRIYCAMLDKTEREVLENREESEREFHEKGGWRIKFIDRPSLDKKLIETTLEKFKPALCIIDNADKIKGFDTDRKDLTLASIYKWLRELAKTYCPLISIGQADATAHNKRWVDEAQMADSKTGKPSETDFSLGIGKTSEEGLSSMRYIYISRNKCKGGPETVPELRHGKFEVLIKPEFSIYEDINI